MGDPWAPEQALALYSTTHASRFLVHENVSRQAKIFIVDSDHRLYPETVKFAQARCSASEMSNQKQEAEPDYATDCPWLLLDREKKLVSEF